MYYTPKAYLVEIKVLPPGSENTRGRISKDNDALIRKAVAENPSLEIKGYQRTGQNNTSSTNNRSGNSENPVDEKSVTKTKATGEKVISEVYYTYPEESFRAVEVDTGKMRGMREACRNCRCSLVGCYCGAPEIVSFDGTKSVRVRIEPVGK